MFLKVEDIHKSFHHNEILKGISFTMEQGTVLSIIGSSGSGKTTLLRCLNFLETPDVGRMILNGEILFDSKEGKSVNDVELRNKRLHFGLVFQQFNLFPQYTALRNITLAAELLQLKSADKNKRKDIMAEIEASGRELLSRIGLSNKANLYPYQLSGGQQQRVAIARALALKPDILCFDEPTSALDPELTGEVLQVIKELKNDNATMIIVTHEMEFAAKVSDHVIYMAEGKIVEQGTPYDVFENPQNEKTRSFLFRDEI